MDQIEVHKGRVTKIQISLGYDVSNDVITSQIREGENSESNLIATWAVSFFTDGVDGELILTLDDSDREIENTTGYMDLKRVTGGEPVHVWDDPLEVYFKETVTV